MKSYLHIKFLIAYLVVGVLSGIFAAVIIPRITEEYFIHTEASDLTDHAQKIARAYQQNPPADPEQLLHSNRTYADGLNAVIWITDQNGMLLLSSEWDRMRDPLPTDFDPLDFRRDNHITGTFYGIFSEDVISVYAPLSANFQTIGYIVIHEPLSAIKHLQDLTVNMTFLTAAVTFFLAASLLLVFYLTVSRPMKKVSTAVREYARGNLSYKANLHSHDELGYLAAGLNDMSSRLNEIGDDQKKFLANVSHDFRSPLTSIKGYLEAILDGTIPPELQPKYLQIVLNETGRLTKLTRNMLELNTFSSQGTYLEYSDFDINHEIRKVIASMEGTCREKGITFDVIRSERILMVHADLSRIQQVLYNLIDNAIKFSHIDGVITIETSSQNELAFISVKDNGTGIAKENIKKIWDRFYKSDSSRGKDKSGTGLGLAIVREIIRAHGMNIDVISTEGVGSEFIFRLALSE